MDYTPPLLGGNNVKLFTSGKDKFDHLLADIEKARQHIHIEYYVLNDDEIGMKVQEALIRKLGGLEIRIIYDSFGSRKAKKKFLEEFRRAGIETEPFFKTYMVCNHFKIELQDSPQNSGYRRTDRICWRNEYC